MNICSIYLLVFSTLNFLVVNFSLCDEVDQESTNVLKANIKNVTSELTSEQSSTNGPAKPWISEMFAEAERQFTIHPEASDQCKKSFKLYKEHLKNNSLWAVRMYESSQWPRLGILVGSKPFLGYFDECVSVNAHNIKGKHCLVESTLDFNDDDAPVVPEHSFATPNQNSSVWLALQMYKNDINRIERNKFSWTLCVPSSCSSVDLSTSLNRTLRNVFEKYSITTNSELTEDRCHTNQVELDGPYYYVKYLIRVLLLAVIFSSIIHAKGYRIGRGKYSNVVKCFSIQQSYHKLMDVTPEREYMLIHVFKVFSIVVLLILHRLSFMIRHSCYNANMIEERVYLLNNFFVNGAELPDLMFFFSGVLMYKGFIGSSTNGMNEILTKIAKRWLRLFPTYVLIRLFYTYVLPVMSTGVLWHEMRDEANYCKTNLLDALLTLPNARNEKMCIPPSWQMAVDFQLFTIAYVTFTFCRRHKINVIKVTLYLIGLSSVLTFCNVFYNQYIGLLLIDLRNFNVDRNEENRVIFFSSYLSAAGRMAPYFIGTLVAAKTHEMKEMGYRLSKAQIISGSVAVICIQYVVAISGSGLFKLRLKNEFPRLWHAAHGAFVHSTSNLPLIFLFFVYLANGFECLEKRIPRISVPLSRLSHVVSLSHFVVILPHIFSQRTLVPYTTVYSLIHLIAGDVFLCYTLAVLIYYLVDGPVQNLTLLCWKNPRKNEIQETQEEDQISKKND